MADNNSLSPRRLLVIHHSHTDVGYTELQQRIERWQVDFIRQALDIIDHQNKLDSEYPRFVWTCESFWSVEKFLERATPDEKTRFEQAVRSGSIGLSGSYLNFNELIDYDVLLRMQKRAAAYGSNIGVAVDSAMTADINGYSWGYSQALHDCGICNLFTCIHTHHGMFPLGRRHLPFWWETPAGDRILVWNGEHYHYGNELGLVPGAVSSYITKDECDADMIFGDHWGVAEIRIPRFFEKLAESGYPFDFVPVMASGLRTDNGPPSAHIPEFIHRWNSKHGDRYRIEMISLSEFFHLLRRKDYAIPSYRGDWPDWWSDGAASAPEYTRLFRKAQRDLRYYEALLKRYPDLSGPDISPLDYDLALYAEHTFSHADSVSRPWQFLTLAISARKKAYAAEAYEKAQSLLDEAMTGLGAAALKTDMPLRYRVINPLDRGVDGVARLPVGHFEFNELKLNRGALIQEASTGKTLPHQIENAPLGGEFCVFMDLAPGEEKEFEIIPQASASAVENLPTRADESSLETPFVRIEWRPEEGIVSWLDKSGNRDLLRPDRRHAPFTPIYEVTPEVDDERICAVRGEMGLNRKGQRVMRSAGRLMETHHSEAGPIFATSTLRYKVDGMKRCWVELKAYADQPRVDVTIRMHKVGVWRPENVYLALPFAPGTKDYELWLDKTGAIVRPRKDQIPGTLIDYYSLQEGLALITGDYGIAIATPDTNLIQIGDLDHQPRKLHDSACEHPDEAHLFAWLMTNYWETNFDADLGGFYEFSYSIMWGGQFNDPRRTLQYLRDINHGVRCFRLKGK